MLTKLDLEYFKCFKKLQLPLGPLTLLAGKNAAGKSSTLQALASLHQTAIENEWSRNLILNGSAISLGSAGDVIDQIAGGRQFRIGLQTDLFECLWTMEGDRSAFSVPIQQISWRQGDEWQLETHEVKINNQPLRHLLPLGLWETSIHAQNFANSLLNLTYLSADRLGPRETYPVSNLDPPRNIGSRGERAVWFLYHLDSKQPLDGLILSDFPPQLPRQTEAWMKRFFPGTVLQPNPIIGTNLMTLGIRTNDATGFHRPQNVGYGLSYVLPILVACLAANRGDVVMVENPEAHLHPSGQSAMGEFLARSVASGLQVILETHSDHVLNGIRRAVKKSTDGRAEPPLASTDVIIHFFTPRTENEEDAQVISLLMDKYGNLDQWPASFFDQADKDTAFLIDWES